jgi:hypothetical protein
VNFAAVTLRVASQRVIPKVTVYFVIDSVRKLLDTPSYFIRTVCIVLLFPLVVLAIIGCVLLIFLLYFHLSHSVC